MGRWPLTRWNSHSFLILILRTHRKVLKIEPIARVDLEPRDNHKYLDSTLVLCMDPVGFHFPQGGAANFSSICGAKPVLKHTIPAVINSIPSIQKSCATRNHAPPRISRDACVYPVGLFFSLHVRDFQGQNIVKFTCFKLESDRIDSTLIRSARNSCILSENKISAQFHTSKRVDRMLKDGVARA